MTIRIGSARERLITYPILLSKCAKETKSYAKCIRSQVEVKHAVCEKEFLVFMNRMPEGPSHVSLFPIPPWELINKYTDSAVARGTAPPPPQIPSSTSYQTFGIQYNTDDPILRPLESFGFRRIYPQTCSRKAELKKLNFSILANYLDLLDIITRDPSSLRRKEKLDHIGQLFINMHHLLNEYRPHQARDLLREMLTYQVKIARETVHLGEQYLVRANETLSTAVQAISSDLPPTGGTSVSFEDLGPELDCLLSGIQADMKNNPPAANIKMCEDNVDLTNPFSSPSSSSCENAKDGQTDAALDPCIWSFLQQKKSGFKSFSANEFTEHRVLAAEARAFIL
ncbi:Mediator of RNA polymerase II transcription subunit 7-B [Echinococcus granulosus]|uniref:Mediator of RNA polymerase II transcription subunit 7 n=1 Tax=Echinococcus granulosus TaxID=6210 RepID=A0A068W9T0_ECHGR|nr:Mediator of RNA polymerase II transcription subunit 7-B [Echinococcus granulosus]CDS16753.1 Mediator of RNA polymerase II transcription [Echinococcus granulosus]